jgi:hypothetical protein
MFVVELFLPIEKNDGRTVPAASFERIKMELTERFGGVTAFVRSPAEGAWKASDREVVRDRVAIFEVITEELDATWWRAYRSRLEAEFEQEEVLVRAYRASVL